MLNILVHNKIFKRFLLKEFSMRLHFVVGVSNGPI